MQQRPTFKLAYSILIALSACISAAAQADASQQQEEQAQAYAWPSSAPLKLGVSKQKFLFDGYPSETIRFTASGISFETVLKRNLAVDHNMRVPRFSIAMKDERMPGNRIGISLYEREKFLPDLERATWDAYLRGIPLRNTGAIVTYEQSNLEERAGLYVLNQSYRQVAYEEPLPDGNVRKTREIFAFLNGKLLVFTFQGYKENIDANTMRINNFIGSMSLAATSEEEA